MAHLGNDLRDIAGSRRRVVLVTCLLWLWLLLLGAPDGRAFLAPMLGGCAGARLRGRLDRVRQVSTNAPCSSHSSNKLNSIQFNILRKKKFNDSILVYNSADHAAYLRAVHGAQVRRHVLGRHGCAHAHAWHKGARQRVRHQSAQKCRFERAPTHQHRPRNHYHRASLDMRSTSVATVYATPMAAAHARPGMRSVCSWPPPARSHTRKVPATTHVSDDVRCVLLRRPVGVPTASIQAAG